MHTCIGERQKNIFKVATTLYFSVHVVTLPLYGTENARFDDELRIIHFKLFGDWQRLPAQRAIIGNTVMNDKTFYEFCKSMNVST